MEECRVVAINNLISYISPTENPLSANVVMIEGKDALWLYDVGNCLLYTSDAADE